MLRVCSSSRTRDTFLFCLSLLHSAEDPQVVLRAWAGWARGHGPWGQDSLGVVQNTDFKRPKLCYKLQNLKLFMEGIAGPQRRVYDIAAPGGGATSGCPSAGPPPNPPLPPMSVYAASSKDLAFTVSINVCV